MKMPIRGRECQSTSGNSQVHIPKYLLDRRSEGDSCTCMFWPELGIPCPAHLIGLESSRINPNGESNLPVATNKENA
jgi:hypothetical protein